MTIHISYQHKCAQCDTEYIPYDEVIPCPKCGLIEEERFDLISKAVMSVRSNLEKCGSYIPYAWAVFTYGDQVLSLLFRLLEHDRKHPGQQPFRDLAHDVLHEEIDWGDQPYQRDYVYGIAIRVHEELQKA